MSHRRPTLAQDTIAARFTIEAANRQGTATAEVPPWLTRSYEGEWWPSVERPVPARQSVVIPQPRHLAVGDPFPVPAPAPVPAPRNAVVIPLPVPAAA